MDERKKEIKKKIRMMMDEIAGINIKIKELEYRKNVLRKMIDAFDLELIDQQKIEFDDCERDV
jgi:butyrate kinase